MHKALSTKSTGRNGQRHDSESADDCGEMSVIDRSCPLRPVDLVDNALCIGHRLDQAPYTAQHGVEVRAHAVAD